MKHALVFTKPINSRIFGNSEPEVPSKKCVAVRRCLPSLTPQFNRVLLVGRGEAPMETAQVLNPETQALLALLRRFCFPGERRLKSRISYSIVAKYGQLAMLPSR